MENIKVIPNTANEAGPTAPKDPEDRRGGFFVLYETLIEATVRPEGKPSQEIYLDNGRLAERARYTGGIEDSDLLKLLGSTPDLRKLVHSIGVTIKAEQGAENLMFVFRSWGKSKLYESGTTLRVPCKADGTEVVVNLEDVDWADDDSVPGLIAFEFEKLGELATASVIFYVNDGFTVPEVTIEPPVAWESEGYRHMITKSLMSQGNNRRLKAAISKARLGEEVTIAYIGGSITQGAGAKPIHTQCYAYQSYLRFKERFGPNGGDNIHFVKSGVGGTPSELGIIRYDRDILRGGQTWPDIVVVEFAVNDEGDETKGNCYESLCRKILEADNHPAVILLFSVFLNDWNLQDRLSPVGRHYGLPMVSVKDAVVEQFKLTRTKGNLISKRQFFYDIYHPTNDGHRIMADCLDHLFAQTDLAEEDEREIEIEKVPVVIGCNFSEIRLLDRENIPETAQVETGGFTGSDQELQMVEMDVNPFGTPQFPYNWMHTAVSGHEAFKLTITCRSLILAFKDSGRSDFGKAEVFLDGVKVLDADPHINNWTHCNATLIFQHEQAAEHWVEIRMAPDDAEKCFTILGFGYCV